MDPTSTQSTARMSSNRSVALYQTNDSSWNGSIASHHSARQYPPIPSSMRGHAREDRSYKQSPHHAHRRPSASGQSTTSSLDSRSRLAPSTAYGGTTGPISPIDFTISRKSQENQQGLHSYRGQDDKDYGRFKRSDFGDASSSSASKTYMPTRIAQAVIIKNLHQASDLVQATLLEVRLILTHKMITLSQA